MEKGFGEIEAVASAFLPDVHVDVLGYVGGSNDLKGSLKKILAYLVRRKRIRTLKKLSTQSNVSIIGLVPTALEYVDSADILVNPFTVDHFSRPIIEAFAYGKPVITSHLPATSEVVDHGINGLIVDLGNEGALADAIAWLCENPEQGRKYGSAGRAKAEQQFSTPSHVRQVLAVYGEALEVD